MKYGVRIKTTRTFLRENYGRLFYTKLTSNLKYILFDKEPLFAVYDSYGIAFQVYDCGLYGICIGDRIRMKDAIKIPDEYIDRYIENAGNIVNMKEFENGLHKIAMES